jgi:hypothetical protein
MIRSAAARDAGVLACESAGPPGRTSISPRMKAIERWILPTLLSVCLLRTASAAATDLVPAVVAWGDNSFRQITVPVGTTNIAASAGYYRNLALTIDRKVIAWGSVIANDATFVPNLTSIAAMAVGGQHSLALTIDGTVVAWGDNSLGQTIMPPGLSGVMAIAAGTNHSLALRNNHNIVTWGQYNNGASNVDVTPSVPPGLTNIIAIACGDSHSLALRSNGLVVAWGNNSSLQTNVPAGLTNVAAIAAGAAHSLALRSDGSVIAWGDNSAGQTNVPAGLANVMAIAAGGSHSLALRSNGIVIAWGSKASGQTEVPAWLTNVTAIAAGYAHCLALTLDPSPIITLDGVGVVGDSVTRTNTTLVAMSSTFGPTGDIFYTLDDSAPDFFDIPYTGPFTLASNAPIRAIAYDNAYTNQAEAARIMVNILPAYPLTVTTGGGGSFSLSPPPLSGTTNLYPSNAVVRLTAIASDGWSFMNWGDAGSTSVTNDVVMNGARTFRAVFGTPLIVSKAGTGDVSQLPPMGLYPYGTNVLLTAHPDVDYAFYGWTNAATGFANPVSLTITSPAPTITALFGQLNSNRVALTVVSNGAGTVTVSPQRIVYTKGETVTLVAVPTTNHVFTDWTDDVTGTLDPLVLTLNTSMFITASFSHATNVGPTVDIDPPLNRTLAADADTTLSAHPTGDSPLRYQWRFNAAPIAGATTTTLVLSDLTPGNVGRYDLIVTGPFSSVTSAPAVIALFGLEMVPSDDYLVPLLILDSAPGIPYQIQYATNLHGTIIPTQYWNPLISVTNDETRFYYVDEPVADHRFYRAVRQ